MSDPTALLQEIITKHASEEKSYAEIQQLIGRGADIRTLMSDGKSMIEHVIEEKDRIQQTSPLKAENCRRVKELLEQRASDLLSELVLSNSSSIHEMESLVKLRASCHQEQKFGPLGLLGKLLSQQQTDIRFDVIQFLLKNDEDAKFVLTKVDDDQQTCLFLAKNNSLLKKDVINYLQRQLDMLLNQIPITHPQLDVNEVAKWIRLGANPKVTDELGNTVLSNAVRENNVDLVRVLIANGCDTRHINKVDKTPLQIAEEAIPRNASLIAILSEQSVNDELKNLIRKKRSGLKKQDVIDLLQKGANINARMGNNDSFLHYLVTHDGTPEMLTAFVNDFNADLLATNNQGFRPIELCILHDKKPFDILRTFLKLEKISTDVFFNDIWQQSLLDFAIKENKSECADIIEKELIRRLWIYAIRANTNDGQNQNLLNEIKKLIAYGASINSLNSESDQYKGWSVLHLACKTTTKSFVEYLVRDLKANCELKNINDDRPISIAAEYGQIEIVQYLNECASVQINVFNKGNDTPLHLAAKKFHYRIVRYLILWGANEEAQNRSRQTPLILAEKSVVTQHDDIEKKKTIDFLRTLIFPKNSDIQEESMKPITPTFDPNTCELLPRIDVNEMQRFEQETIRGNGNEWFTFLKRDPNSSLHVAARNGSVLMVKQAMNDGADICYLQDRKSAYEVARASLAEYTLKANSESINSNDRRKFCAMALGCEQIVDDLLQSTQTQLRESIKKGDSTRMMAYHDTGIPITPDLLDLACTSSDNVAIVDYLVRKNPNVYEAMYNYTKTDSPYQLAKKVQFNKVASYVKYQLSLECEKAIEENNLELVKQLIRAGANVDLIDTNNLMKAIDHENLELIQILCKNGAKIPAQWLESDGMTLKNDIQEQMKPSVTLLITRNLIDRKLRLAAASGDFKLLVKCQRLGADIQSKNCHGSTALLCALEHGNYFRIVFSLVSRGATMLHSNENQPMSLIELCKQKNYKQIEKCLTEQLNKQFTATLLDDDRQNAAAFEALGADFNYQDVRQRTPLHYAVEYHSKDLVSWLCERGSSPMLPDGNGDYPITLAADKGDYAVVEFFVTKYPTTKEQINKAGLTPLKIAQQRKFGSIVELIQTGKSVPESSPDPETDKPKHSYETLLQAAINGHVKIIQEFVEQRYESKEDKKSLCYTLIQIAKKAKQWQIVDILEPYYYSKLKTDLASDMEQGGNVTLTERYKKILFGYLSSLSDIIANSSVTLDPMDPNSYAQFFSDLTKNIIKRSQTLQEVNSEQDVKNLIDQDLANSKEQLAKINEQLEELLENRNSLEARIEDVDERLFKQEKLTASQRQTMFEERETEKKRLAAYDCSMFIFQRQQEAMLMRQNTINFIKNNPNLIMFYRTVENRLEALFHSILAAQGGYVKKEATFKNSRRAKMVNALPTNIPVANIVIKSIQAVLSPILSKLDEEEQRKEWHNILTLGNIEELSRVASDTAGLVTLYYREQIASIDPSEKIESSDMFNSKADWIRDLFYNIRSANSKTMAVVMVAEYVSAWIIEALKAGQNYIIPTESLPHQLWLYVAKQDPVDQKTVTSVVHASAGRQKIRLNIKDSVDHNHKKVELRHLIGCVSVFGNDGTVYQYPMMKNVSASELQDLKIFGYVYVTPFSSNEKALESIVTGRKLLPARRDKLGDIQTRFQEIIQYAETYGMHDDEPSKQSFITAQTADTVARLLRQQKVFADPKDVKDGLRKSEEKMRLRIDVLHEEIQQKSKYYESLVTVTLETLKQQSLENQKTMKKEIDTYYNEISERVTRKIQDFERSLEQLMEKRMEDIKQELRENTKQISKMAEAANAQSLKAITQANQASEFSRKAVEQGAKAIARAEKIEQSNEKRKEELQSTAKNCEATVKQTAITQIEFCERAISKMRTKFEHDMEQAHMAVRESAEIAKQSARVAQQLVSEIKHTQKAAKSQVEAQNQDSQNPRAEVKGARQQYVDTWDSARKVEKEAKQSGNTSAPTNGKIHYSPEKVDKITARL